MPQIIHSQESYIWHLRLCPIRIPDGEGKHQVFRWLHQRFMISPIPDRPRPESPLIRLETVQPRLDWRHFTNWTNTNICFCVLWSSSSFQLPLPSIANALMSTPPSFRSSHRIILPSFRRMKAKNSKNAKFSPSQQARSLSFVAFLTYTMRHWVSYRKPQVVGVSIIIFLAP